MTKPVILCVDDEKLVLTALKSQLLHHFGHSHRVELAQSAEEALELLDELAAEPCEVPLIITDYVMPGMYGDELLVRVQTKSPQTLSVMVTGQATADAVGEAVNRAGLFRYIAKPWQENDLRLTVSTALDSYQQARLIQRRDQQRQALATIIALALEPDSLEQQLTKALTTLLALPDLAGARAAIYLPDSDGTQLLRQVQAGAEARFPLHRAPLSAAGCEQDPCCFALSYQGQAIGLLELQQPGFSPCQWELQELLTACADSLAGIIQLKQYHQALERQNRELEQTVQRRTQALQEALEQQARLNDILLEANQKLDFYASKDDLTALHNRRFFMQLARSELERARRYHHPTTFMMLDLDFFKEINDEFGHMAGDHVLQQVARILESESREPDILGRLGGEEFAILSPESTLEQATQMAERICERIRQTTLEFDGHEIRLTVSIGISEVQADEETIDAAMSRADQALYRSKGTGRNQVTITA